MKNNQPTSPAASVPSAAAAPLIVGVGASAGGLQAFEELLAGLGDAPGVAIVLVQHADPQTKSLLPQLLARSTSLDVVELTKPTKPNANTVYICPPRGLLAVRHGSLLIEDQEDDVRPAAPIDHFFRSLAESQGESGIGIILSGAGSDGTLGLKSISDSGGMTFAQEPSSARFDAMPRSAATTGVADHVLPPTEIARELINYVNFLNQPAFRATSGSLHEQIERAIPEIAERLLQATDHNFQHYKTSTLGRRILRRIQVLKVAKVADYIKRLKQDQQEAQLLFRELLIGVTAFFRDPQSFEHLNQQVLPKLFAGRRLDDPVRIWVPGCATGEEAYTIAMLCQEYLDKQHSSKRPADAERATEQASPSFQIFASDIDERALSVARDGIYPVGVADDMSPERLERFFVLKGKRFHVRHELREKVLFSLHNLISDPPFLRQDLISCRNLLIYLGPHLQKKLIPLFHYSLRPNGYLFLGPSESMTSHGELFRTIDAKHRISQRKETAITRGAALYFPSYGDSHQAAADAPATADNKDDIVQVMQRIVLDEFAPKVVVIDEEGQVLCSSAETQKYLSIGEGTYQNNILKMARRGLRLGLRSAITQAKAKRRRVTHENVSVETEQGKQPVMLTVQPMMQMGEDSGLFLVVFHDVGLPMNLSVNPPTNDEDLMARGKLDRTADLLVEQLERELSTSRDDLDRALQEMEATNEELKSSNEELLSMNEELQSANEELQTSKEEIQAALERIARSDTDRQNLLDSTKVATLFVGDDLQIRSFTAGMTAVYNLIPTDVGRPLRHITHTVVAMPDYPADPTQIDQWPIEDEIESQSGRWFLRRIQPYLAADKRRDGMVVTFYDITEQLRLRMRLAAAHGVASLLAEADSFETVIPEVLSALRKSLVAEACLLWLVDTCKQELKCVATDALDSSVQAFLDVSREQRFACGAGLPGTAWKDHKPVWFEDIRSTAGFARAEVATTCNLISGVATPIVVGAKFKGVIEIYTTRQPTRDPELLSMLKTIGNDIGQFIRRRRLDDMFRDEVARKTAILQSALDCIITMDTEGRIIEFNPAAEQTFGYTLAEVSGRPLAETIIPLEYREAHNNGLARFLTTGNSNILGKRTEVTALRADGSLFPAELAINVSHGRDGMPFFTAYLRDITQRKAAETALLERERNTALMAELQSAFSQLNTAESIAQVGCQMITEHFGLNRCTLAELSDDARVANVFYEQCDSQLRSFCGQQQTEDFASRNAMARLGQGQVLVIDDMHDESIPSEIATNFATMRVAANICAPYIDDGRLKFTLSISKSVPHHWMDSEISLAQELASLLYLRITRARAEEQLAESLQKVRDSEQEFRNMANAAPAMLWVTDENHRFTFISQRWYQFTGQSESETLEFGWTEAIHPDDREASRDIFLAAAEQREAFELDYRLRTADGSYRWAIDAGQPRFDEQGKFTGFVGAVINAHDRNEAQAAIRVSEERLRNAAEAAGFGMLHIDLELNTVNYSQELRKLLGLPEDTEPQLATGLIPDWIHPEDHTAFAQFHQRLISLPEEESDRIDHRIISSDGQIRWVRLQAKTIYTGNGAQRRPTQVIGTVLDITQQRDFERSLNDARAQAVAANESKSEFLANMSHEIRTPMTAILGYADLLREHISSPEAINHLSTIRRNGDYLLDIINDILDLSKIEAGKLEVERERFDPTRLVEDVRSIMEVRATENNLRLEVIYDGRIPAQIESDGKRLKQILINLVGNAIKFTPHGEVKIVVRALHCSPLSDKSQTEESQTLAASRTDGRNGTKKERKSALDSDRIDALQFTIIDTGIGMNHDQLKKLFRPFEQGDSSVSRHFGGTGLGLAISRRLAAMLGGHIAVNSELGHGSTFRLTVAVGEVADVPLVRPTPFIAPAQHATQQPPLILNCDVLVVDDRRDIRFLSKRLLTKAGATVEECEDGQLAVDFVRECIAQQRCPDLILLDMQMPNLDGYETARQLRQLGFANPIIALTADAMQGDMNRCIECGCNDYLSKPIDAEQLLQLVAQMTNG